MTRAPLSAESLVGLTICRGVAIASFNLYEEIYDQLDEDTVERESVGRAMAQKTSFIGAVDAILSNHTEEVPKTPVFKPGYHGNSILDEVSPGEHLAQERRFLDALNHCIDTVEDDLTIDMLKDHLEAAKIAVSVLKATSLKI